MRPLLAESALKGLFLGLLFFVAVQVAESATAALAVALPLGLAAGLFAARLAARPPTGSKSNDKAAVLTLPWLSPLRVASAMVLAVAVAALMLARPDAILLLGEFALAGVLIGLAVFAIRSVRHAWLRLGLCLALSAGVTASTIWLAGQPNSAPLQVLGTRLAVGLPFFLLLAVIAGDLSEADVGLLAALLAVIGWCLAGDTAAARIATFGLAGAVYFLCVFRILARARVIQHTLRGAALGNAGKYRPALLSFRRALILDPANPRARERFWAVHRAIDVTSVGRDPETLRLLDFDLCLERAGSLLLERPSEATLAEAGHLLDLVESQRPELLPAVDYWRAVADLHGRRHDDAARRLRRILDPTAWPARDKHRSAILFSAWQLALVLHPEMKRRVGETELTIPGRRLEAIAAVERRLAVQADDQPAWELKRLLYAGLKESDYFERGREGEAPAEPRRLGSGESCATRQEARLPSFVHSTHSTGVPGAERSEAPEARPGSETAVPTATSGTAGINPAARQEFDHAYVEQLGLALINDPVQWQRGAEYLRIAATGLPLRAPSLCFQIGQAEQRADQQEDAWHSYESAKSAGLAAGLANLGEGERQDFLAAVRLLADGARLHGDLDAAAQNYRLLAESGKGGHETYRHLADIAERQGDVFAALRATEQGLVCDSKDKELLERKDRYYYSVTPEALRDRLDSVRSYFDVGYCLRKARALLDHKDADADVVAWAEHLAALAEIAEPDALTAKVLRARALRRRGDTETARALLEDVHARKPEAFASSADEDAWFLACRILGDAYLDELGKPERAVACFTDYRKSAKSGADTIYKLGRAYEQLGDLDRAGRCYKQVTAYDGHPLVYDARMALDRLQSGPAAPQA